MRIGRRTLAILGFVVLGLLPTGVVSAQGIAQPPPLSAYPPLDPAACVQKAQHILILDMKSGWWQGDGGEFHNMLLPRIVRDCALVDIEYYYVQFIDLSNLPPMPTPVPLPAGAVAFLSYYPERPTFPNNGLVSAASIPSRPWNEYTQVWVLSGGDQDPADVPTTDPFFLTFVTKFATPPTTPGQPGPSYFFGAGLGHHDHVNKMLAALQLPELFQTHSIELQTPHADESEIVVLTRLTQGAQLVPHPLFESVDAIADHIHVGGGDSESDYMLTADNPFQVIGQNTEGEPAIAVKDTDAHRLALDTGISRFYALYLPAEASTYRYLQNIIKYLAR